MPGLRPVLQTTAFVVAAAIAAVAGCTSGSTSRASPTPIPTGTQTSVPSATGSPTATATISRTPTVTLAFTTTPCGCWTPAGNALLVNGGFETGTLSGWTFVPGCGSTGCTAPQALIATPGPADGCCCLPGSGGALAAVACSSFSAVVFSGQGFNPCNYANGRLEQTAVLSCCANLSFCYSYETMKSSSAACYGDDAHATFSVLVSSGGCGTPTVVWQDVVQPCLHPGVATAGNGRWYLPWRSVSLSLCGYAGCTVTLRAESRSRGPEGCWSRLDHATLSGPSCAPPAAVSHPDQRR